MPKSAKAKKSNKVADFSKVKAKLGKGKQQAVNSTDTSYKARSIVLPSQSIASEKETTAPKTKRNLTFDDLLVQAKHYNAGIRKDSLLGMKELLVDHPEMRVSELTAMVNIIVRLVNDEDHAVRTTLVNFLAFLFPSVPIRTLTPHLPLLLLHTSSALSHIFPEIRIDAVKIVGILLGVCPKECVDGWVEGRGLGARVGEGLMGVLGLGGSRDSVSTSQTTSGSNALRPQAKQTVLSTLSTFLSHALSAPSSTASTSSSPAWFLAPSFTNQAGFAEFETLLKGKKVAVNPIDEWALSAGGNGWELNDFVGGREENSSKNEESWRVGVEATKLYLTLHPLMLSTFLDAGPTAFSPSGSASHIFSAGVELELVAIVGDIVGTLGRTLLREAATVPKDLLRTAKTNLKTLLGHMSIYFPFNSVTFQKRDVKSEALLLSLSLSYASLVAQVSLTQAQIAPRTKASNPPERAKALEDCYARIRKGMDKSERKLVSAVAKWVAALLKGEHITLANPLGQPLPPQTYLSILPTAWSLLNQPPPAPVSKAKLAAQKEADEKVEEEDSIPHAVASALFDHLNRVSSDSAVKKLGIEFVGRLCLLESLALYVGPFRLLAPSPLVSLKPKLERFYQTLPKTLWELGTKDLVATDTILRLIHHLTLTCPSPSTALILPSFLPYFYMTHPTRGALPGPWAKLPSSQVNGIRRLALDVAWAVAEAAPNVDVGEPLRTAVGLAVAGVEEDRVYWEGLADGW